MSPPPKNNPKTPLRAQIRRAHVRRAQVLILPKKGLRDPQGETIAKALDQRLPFQGRLTVAKGSLIEITFAPSTSKKDAEQHVQKICEDLLVNPLIEQYEIIWSES